MRVLALLLVLCLSAQAKPIVIDLDYGGSLDDHLRWWERVRQSGTPVRIEGPCISACSFVLMLPRDQVCVTPSASLGFHLVAINGTPEVEFTQALIRRYYPKVVQDWLSTKHLRLLPLTFMDADTIKQLGIFPACES